jgi:glycosyltransferase involved in cell wall biosynthesis
MKPANILIVSHGYKESYEAGGPPQDICDYFLKKNMNIDYIVNPISSAEFRYSFILEFKNGIIVGKRKSFKIIGPEWLQYIQHFFITIYFLLSSNIKSYQVCFALDNLSLISILIFKKLGFIKKLIYYSIDYTPKRFENWILNSMYQTMDKASCYNSDINWVVSKEMVNARKRNGLVFSRCSKFLEVPIGFHQKYIKIQPMSKIDMFHLIFVGYLAEKQGLQMVIKSLPKIISKFPKINLTIIGTGDYENTLKDLAKKMHLKNRVKFKGFVNNPRTIEKILTTAGIGLAPYKPIPESFTYYADPGKIKLYLGCGLPVLTTNIPPISKIITNKKAGEIVPYSEDGVLKGLTKILSDKYRYKLYRKSAISLSKNYDEEKILRIAIAKTFRVIKMHNNFLDGTEPSL